MKIILITLALLATLLPIAQAGNPELDHLRAQYAAALDLLRDEQKSIPSYVKLIDEELSRLAHATQVKRDVGELLVSSKWVRSGDIGKDGKVFQFFKDGTMGCNEKSKFQNWVIKGEFIVMGSPGYSVEFRMLADGKGMVAHYDNIVVLFEMAE